MRTSVRHMVRVPGLFGCLTCGMVYLLAFCVLAGQPAEPKATQPSPKALPKPIVSGSGQFFVYASDTGWAVQTSVHAERVKSAVLGRLGAVGAWRDPILLIVHDEPPSPTLAGTVHLSVRHIISAQPYYMLHCYAPLDSQKLLEGIIEAVTIEFAARSGHLAPQTTRLPRAPLWWVQGMAECLREDMHEVNQRILERAWRENAPTPAETLLTATSLPADALEQRYFKAQCGVLVRGLTSSPDRQEAATDFLQRVVQGASPLESFYAAYLRQYASRRSLEKWWALECASQTALAKVGLFSMKETAAVLDELLVFKLVINDEKGGERLVSLRPDEIPPYAAGTEMQSLLREHVVRLRLLGTQAHPLYREPVELFAVALERLQKGETTAFGVLLRKAQAARAAAESYGARFQAWMDEIEVSAGATSRKLETFLDAIEKTRETDRQRASAIKNYIDGVEKEAAR